MSVNGHIQDLQASIQRMLDWDLQEYASFQYDMGVEYLKYYLPGDDESVAHLEGSKFFWAWWRKRWADREQEFIADSKFIRPDQLEQIYKSRHQAKVLSAMIYPNKMVWQKSIKQDA